MSAPPWAKYESVSGQLPLICHCFLVQDRDNPLQQNLNLGVQSCDPFSLVAFELHLFTFLQSCPAADLSAVPALTTFLFVSSEGFPCEELP